MEHDPIIGRRRRIAPELVLSGEAADGLLEHAIAGELGAGPLRLDVVRLHVKTWAKVLNMDLSERDFERAVRNTVTEYDKLLRATAARLPDEIARVARLKDIVARRMAQE